jgi:hypothetical protein
MISDQEEMRRASDQRAQAIEEKTAECSNCACSESTNQPAQKRCSGSYYVLSFVIPFVAISALFGVEHPAVSLTAGVLAGGTSYALYKLVKKLRHSV